MNVFIAHAQILRKEAPKERGRSGLMVLKVGKNKRSTDALIQSVNQIIVRIPSHLSDRAAKLDVDSYIEIFGHVGGIVRRSQFSGEQHLSAELVANNIQPAAQMVEGNIEKHLFNRFIAIGLLRGVKTPEREGPPSTAYLQIGPDRPDLGRSFQHTGVVAMSAFGRVVDRLVEYEAGTALHVEGRVTGLLRKIPKPGAEGGFEESLEVGLVMDRVSPTAMVAERMLTPFDVAKPETKDATEEASEEAGAGEQEDSTVAEEQR
ncbi:hypothetical protein [Modicisalibacter xianhensis]|uniref:Uncharacterized protein n=1 Tax=Modicisalibacter xianhensis TaxID=442341 RepID=A0A1I3FQ27_9GAMM|nr:hypothetical protein [Halomonas xianhensis]SFI13333.1 hypothetical protein SAMN04487959_12031 [Halomonas xianhensis]